MSSKLKMYNPESICELPRQTLSPWIRWPLRVAAFPFMWIDIVSTKLVHFFIKPAYKIEGACKQTGNCCRYIHMGWPKKGHKSPFAKIYLFWQTEVLGFYFKDFDFVEDNEVIKVMGCRYLQKDGRCKHYRLRPALCRDWPKVNYTRKPTILKGCGYRAVLRKNK